MTTVKRYEIWLANLDPQRGTETGKVKPVLVVQSNLLNSAHPSTVICPITTNVQPTLGVLRVHLKKGEGGLEKDSDVLIDQLRTIDNKRLLKKLGGLPKSLNKKVSYNLKVVLDLDW